jgi:hypothetical protein
VPKRPPDPVPEVPPETRPEGDGAVWIPGYWAWDLGRKDYLWVSGVWRVPPPGRKWVPGAWAAAEGGFRWTPGFWAPDGAGELPFVPEPPASLDNGPSGPPPDEDRFYVPGTWLFQGQRYAWRPGFWTINRPGWVWTPAAYLWTPGGYVFVDGFWDYPLEDRGLLFAPAVFNRPLGLTPGWTYQPSYAVTPAALTGPLFVGPGAGTFWFGDYYGPAWRNLGYRPWFAGGPGNTLYSYYRWRYRADPGWSAGLAATYQGRQSGTQPRPPATVAAAGSLRVVQPAASVQGAVRVSGAQAAVARGQALQFHEAARVRAGGFSAGGAVVHPAGPAGGWVAGAGFHAGATVHHPAPVRVQASGHVAASGPGPHPAHVQAGGHVSVHRSGPPAHGGHGHRR